jgi:Zn-finger domain-containing protein
MLSTNDLLRAQIDKMEKLERDMERREHDLKFQHMKELNQVQMQAKARSNECRFLCF